jgi:murein tripeptide amidase MpaA
MTAHISAAFDSGNIDLLSQQGNRFDLEIRRDHLSDFYQWFHFRLTGAKGEPVVLNIVNAGGSAYPGGWEDYGACVSADRQSWHRFPTSYAAGVLTIAITPSADSVWIAYFAPYSMERHHDLIARIATAPGVAHQRLGATLDGQDIDLLTIGEGASRSGSMPASIPANRWPNGGWKARSNGWSIRIARSRAACAAARPSMSCPT